MALWETLQFLKDSEKTQVPYRLAPITSRLILQSLFLWEPLGSHSTFVVQTLTEWQPPPSRFISGPRNASEPTLLPKERSLVF